MQPQTPTRGAPFGTTAGHGVPDRMAGCSADEREKSSLTNEGRLIFQ